MAIVGPGAVKQDEIAPKPSLDGASEYEYVTIFNPLTDDFAIQVAQSKSVDLPVTVRSKTSMIQEEGDIRREYGLQLKNPDYQAKAHISNTTVIKAGQKLNLKGDEAQVAVRQLVNEYLQREGKSKFLADPNVRKAAEGIIIVGRGSVQELLDGKLQSPQSQINDAVAKSNEVQDEAFPGIQARAEGDSEAGSDQESAGVQDTAPEQPREETATKSRTSKK